MSDFNPIKRVDDLREEIDRVWAEIRWVNESPMPKADWKLAVSRWIKQEAEGGSAQHSAFRALRSAKKRDPQFVSETLLVSKGRLTLLPSDHPKVESLNLPLAPSLCWLMGDELERRMHAMIDADEYVPGPPMAGRKELSETLRETLLELELQEEAVIAAAEDEHVFIGRRLDADPIVVLEYDPDGKMDLPSLRGRIGGSPSVVSYPTGGDHGGSFTSNVI